MRSYINCICLHCVFSNGSSNYMDQRRHNRIGCISFFFLLCAFMCVLKFLVWYDAYFHWLHLFVFSPPHGAFLNAPSKYLDHRMQSHTVGIYAFFSNVCLQMYRQIVCMQGCILTLHLFDFSPPCVFKCAFKLAFIVETYSHWLHLFDFFPLCILTFVLELALQREEKLRWLHLFDLSPLCMVL